jgi:hypothetical protein
MSGWAVVVVGYVGGMLVWASLAVLVWRSRTR